MKRAGAVFVTIGGLMLGMVLSAHSEDGFLQQSEASSVVQGGMLAAAGFLLALLLGLQLLRQQARDGDSRRELRLTREAIEKSPIAILISDADNRIITVNHAFTQITGYTVDEVKGKNPAFLSSGRHDKRFYQSLWSNLLRTGTWSGEIWDKRKDGTHYPKWITIHAIREPGGNRIDHFLAIFNDLSERKETEDRIYHMAHHDPLTDLPNRLLLNDRLKSALARIRRDESFLVLIFIDLDDFKHVNDSLGHAVGDRLLIEVAERLRDVARDSDTVSRLGGDEFVLVMEGFKNLRSIEKMARKIVETLDCPVEIDQHWLHVTVSIGVAVAPSDGDDVETLMRHADMAMYHAKEQGRNNAQFYAPEMNREAAERLGLGNALRMAVRRRELTLQFQPMVDQIDGRVSAVEALLRWQHPEQGRISPDRFIPLAEANGSIVSIGAWVLEECCRTLKYWQSIGLSDLRICINLSPRQFRQHGLFEDFTAILALSGVEAYHFELEVTEGALAEKPEQAAELLNRFKARGFSIAVDDFGTGYSSLAYLKTFPIDRLKIDRSFVRDIATDSSDREITTAVIALAHNLNMSVVAEGVEELEQLEFLRQRGCDCVQGFYYSRPLAAESLPDFVRLTSGLPAGA
jgi:diguanylate cyclase (GGDEF)-like protein/PAS domain S-box-containing protein